MSLELGGARAVVCGTNYFNRAPPRLRLAVGSRDSIIRIKKNKILYWKKCIWKVIQLEKNSLGKEIVLDQYIVLEKDDVLDKYLVFDTDIIMENLLH